MTLPIHAVQLDSVWENKSANFAKVRSLLAVAPPAPKSLIVLSEMFATGFSCQISVTAEAEGAETERFLQSLAVEFQCCVIGGVVTTSSTVTARNQALAISPSGEVLARYTKMQPFSLGGEAAVHERGSAPVVFEWGGVKIAPLICYDLRFPEPAREAVRLGAEVLIYIAAWPVKRIQHWITLLKARAIENQAYVIGVNRCGQEPEFSYNGRSLVVDPHGIIIADAGEHEQVLHSQLDPQLMQDWRSMFPALRDAGLL